MNRTIVINPDPATVFCRVCSQCPCCCEARSNHLPDCKYRKAVEIPIGIECEHGRDVCPICDRCTCKEPRQ